MAKPDLSAFAAGLSQMTLTQAEIAVALMWFYRASAPEIAASDLGTQMHELSLTPAVNLTRLSLQLAKHEDTVRGSRKNYFKLKLASVAKLTEAYGPLVGPLAPVVQHRLLPESQTKGTRRYLQSLALQLNGCYESAFYDGCAVMCRRLAETLLIEAFEYTGKGAAIKSGNDYLQFGEIIGIAGSGAHIKLARSTPRTLNRVKAIGDTAAHDRAYITSVTDIDDIAHEFRKLVAELMVLANIHPK